MEAGRRIPRVSETMSQIRKILFWGPLGDEKHFGGGESGNSRTIRALERMGFSVIRCPKPYPFSMPILRWPVYFIQLTYSILGAGLKCVSCAPQFLHVSGFYGHLILWEWALLSMAKLLGIPATYEIRGGDGLLRYNDGWSLYRFLFRMTIATADCVLCQGEVYMDFAMSLGAKTALYYPNSIEMLPTCDGKAERSSDGVVRLVYFGRFARNKRIDLVIKTVDALRHLKIPCSLTLIGDGDGIDISEHKEIAKRLKIEYCMNWLPWMERKALLEKLRYYHFFIFPTENPREGQSNALIEAMAQGIVPVCSDQGFNREVVGRAGVILKSNSPVDFAEAVANIWSGKEWSEMSAKCSNNVRRRFASERTESCLKQVYDSAR